MAQEPPISGRAGTPSSLDTARSDAKSGTRTTASTPTNHPPLTKGQATWENIKGLLWVIVIFLGVRTFLLEAYRIPSGSMKPTLEIGDWLFVNKIVYGPHIPFTNARLPGYREPRRGDVVVFESPFQADEQARGADPTPTLVKRLIAVAGDTIYMRNAVVYVNGVESPRDHLMPVAHTMDYQSPAFAWMTHYALANSRFGPPVAIPSLDNWGPMVVPANHLFMMGDNRYDSKDSRYWGFVPRGNVRGEPLFVYYSYNGEDSDSPLPWLTDIRWSRIGHIIR